MARPGAAWGAVGSMALCVAVLIASEFMPVSLLTPIATDLGVTEGQAGQAISISGLFAVVTSLFVAGLTRSIDRKVVLASFSVLLVVSGCGHARAGLPGADDRARAARRRDRRLLVDVDSDRHAAGAAGAVPQGLAMLNAGNAIAATISAPLGAYLGGMIGWRGAFFFVVPLALLALVWQWIAMPSLPPRGRPGRGNVFRLLGRPQVALGMTAILLLFMGQFALFTYLRPSSRPSPASPSPSFRWRSWRSASPGSREPGASAGCWGRRLYALLVGIPAVMAGIALLLIVFGHSQPVSPASSSSGGSSAPPRRSGGARGSPDVLHDEAEAGGGLQVAVIQFAIMIGAAGGGLMFDAVGWWSAFAAAAALLLGSSLAAFASLEKLGVSGDDARSVNPRPPPGSAGAAASLALPRFGRAQETGVSHAPSLPLRRSGLRMPASRQMRPRGTSSRSCPWI